MKETIWITGASGYTGKHILQLLESFQKKYCLIGFGRTQKNLSGLDDFHAVDVLNTPQLKKIAENSPPALVFHLASCMAHEDEAGMWAVNVGGTVSLIRALADAGCRTSRVVSIGSAAEYRDSSGNCLDEKSPQGGESLYGRTKWVQTVMALKTGAEVGIPVVVARTFNLIGPGLSENLVAGRLCRQFSKHGAEEITVGNTRSERDFLDVRDAVKAYYDLAVNGRPGEIYNVCSGIPVSIEVLLQTFQEMTGNRHRILQDQSLLKAVDVNRVYGSYEKIRAQTGWCPLISLRQSVSDMLEGDAG